MSAQIRLICTFLCSLVSCNIFFLLHRGSFHARLTLRAERSSPQTVTAELAATLSTLRAAFTSRSTSNPQSWQLNVLCDKASVCLLAHQGRHGPSAAAQSRLICTLRNFTTPEPYCSAIGPAPRCLESCTSAVFCPLRTTTRCGPCAVISNVFHLPPAFGIGSTLAV